LCRERRRKRAEKKRRKKKEKDKFASLLCSLDIIFHSLSLTHTINDSYSGDFDGQVPHFGTEQWTRGLGEWYGGLAAGCEGVRPWTADDDGATVPAGRFVQYAASGEFTFLTVARAGHMVPTYRPKEALTMLKRFLAGDGY
jgi:carboxypeptidase C (cathepsin A)